MKTTFTKEDLKKAYDDASDKSEWFPLNLMGTPVDEWDMKEPNFDKWFEQMFPSTREGILAKLEKQYKKEFAGNGYPDEFKAHAGMTECNFGGVLIILSNSGDSVIAWNDWSDAAISDVLTECEIEYHDDPDDDALDEEGNPAFIAQFLFNESWYRLDNFMKI